MAQALPQGNPRYQAFDSNGVPRAGDLLFTYEVGTATKKTTYSDYQLQSANANPIELDGNGQAQVFFTGAVKLVLAESTDTDPPTGTTITDDNVIAQAVQGASQYLLSTYASLDAALTDIGATEAELVVDQSTTLTASETLPSNVSFKILPGSVITFSTYTLDATSTPQFTGAPGCFNYDSSGVITNLRNSNFSWWGGDVGETGANNMTFLASATAATASGVVKVEGGSYPAAGIGTIATACTIRGDDATFTWGSDTSADRGLDVTVSDVKIYGLTLSGPQSASQVTTQVGIHVYGADVDNRLTGIEIKDVISTSWGGAGIRVDFCTDPIVEQCKSHTNWEYGIRATSCNGGRVCNNTVYAINASGSDGENAYGISLDKDAGTEAAEPVCNGMLVNNNTIYNVPTWAGIHGDAPFRCTINGNTIRDVKYGVYLVTPGGAAGLSPGSNTIVGNTVYNNHGTGEVVATTITTAGIWVAGDSSTTATRNIISGNTIDGFGDSDATVATNTGSIHAEDTIGTAIIGNTIANGALVGVYLADTLDVLCASNSIHMTLGPTAEQATGTIQFTGNPSDGDTITINGQAFTYRTSFDEDYEILIGGSLETTLNNTVTQLSLPNAPWTSRPMDGRVTVASYSEDDVDTLTITYDSPGHPGEYFTIAASITAGETVSGATLALASADATAVGSACIFIENSGVTSTGLVSGNLMDSDLGNGIVTYTTCAIDFIGNMNSGTGLTYDLDDGSGPNDSAGAIDKIGTISKAWNVPEVADNDSFTARLAAPDIPPDAEIRMTPSAKLNGLVLDAVVGSVPTVELIFSNETGAAVDLGSITYRITYGKL